MVAHHGEGNADPPDPWERTLGDLVDPTRTGTATDVVNAVSRSISGDAAGWSVPRLLSMAAQVAAARPDPPDA